MWNILPLGMSINGLNDFPGGSTCHILLKKAVYRDKSAIPYTFCKLMLPIDISLLSIIYNYTFLYQNYVFNMIYHIDFT